MDKQNIKKKSKTNKQKVMTMDFPCPVVKTVVPLQKACLIPGQGKTTGRVVLPKEKKKKQKS